MFYCVGENQHSSCSIGMGHTIEEAVNNWAIHDMDRDTSDFIDEFQTYNPTVIEGRELKIQMNYQAPTFIELPT